MNEREETYLVVSVDPMLRLFLKVGLLKGKSTAVDSHQCLLFHIRWVFFPTKKKKLPARRFLPEV